MGRYCEVTQCGECKSQTWLAYKFLNVHLSTATCKMYATGPGILCYLNPHQLQVAISKVRDTPPGPVAKGLKDSLIYL